LKLFDWAYRNGDNMAVELEYVVLPDAVTNMVRNSWANIKDASGKPVPTR